MSTFNRILKKKQSLATFQKSLKANETLAYLGVNMTLERKNRELTQAELGLKAGVSQQHISMLENGQNVETATLIKVCRALGMSYLPIAI